jgi:hypothetical protein
MSINIPTAHKANVAVEFGQLSSMIEWCERNCVSDWRMSGEATEQWNGDTMFYGYEFFFESEKDYVAFLMWKK